MSAQEFKSLTKLMSGVARSGLRTQFAALCYKVVSGKPRVLVITSRGTGRWIIPKGWPQKSRAPHEAAMTEAWEEAGVCGAVLPKPLGLYTYVKEMEDSEDLPCAVVVYPVKVDKLLKRYPEVGQRKRRWVSLKKAANLVDEPELSALLKNFDPKRFG